MEEQGIYRISGNSSDIQKLVAKANQGENGPTMGKVGLQSDITDWCLGCFLDPTADAREMDLEDESDVHAVTGLLKQYFRDLSEPAFTDSLYSEFIAAGSA